MASAGVRAGAVEASTSAVAVAARLEVFRVSCELQCELEGLLHQRRSALLN